MNGRERDIRTGCLVGVLAIVAAGFGQPALAQSGVGELTGALPGGPYGALSIRVSQGGSDLINLPSVPLPNHIKFNDDTSDDYVVLDTWGAGATETDIILKAISDGDPEASFRTTHWYIDSIVPGEIHTPGPISLFDPSAGLIEVEISNITFVNTLTATPMVLDQEDFLVSYMRNVPGFFYKFDDANGFGDYIPGVQAVQVPGSKYHDGITSYAFSSTTGPTVSWKWSGLIPPNPAPDPLLNTPAIDEDGNSHVGDGYVHELGLGVAFVGELVPEPTTALMAVVFAPLALGRGRRRR